MVGVFWALINGTYSVLVKIDGSIADNPVANHHKHGPYGNGNNLFQVSGFEQSATSNDESVYVTKVTSVVRIQLMCLGKKVSASKFRY